MNPAASDDRISWLRLSSCYLPLATPISDVLVPLLAAASDGPG